MGEFWCMDFRNIPYFAYSDSLLIISKYQTESVKQRFFRQILLYPESFLGPCISPWYEGLSYETSPHGIHQFICYFSGVEHHLPSGRSQIKVLHVVSVHVRKQGSPVQTSPTGFSLSAYHQEMDSHEDSSFSGRKCWLWYLWQWLRPSDTAGRRSGRTVTRIWTRWWTRLRGVEHARTGELTSPGRSNMESIKWNLDLRSQTLKHQSNVVNAHTKNIQQLPFREYFCHLCVANLAMVMIFCLPVHDGGTPA